MEHRKLNKDQTVEIERIYYKNTTTSNSMLYAPHNFSIKNIRIKDFTNPISLTALPRAAPIRPKQLQHLPVKYAMRPKSIQHNHVPYMADYVKAKRCKRNWLRRVKKRNKKKKPLPPLPSGTPGDPRLYYLTTYNLNLFQYKIRRQLHPSIQLRL